MDPFGRHNHHHHNRREDDRSENYPPSQYPPQPSYGGAYPQPPYDGGYPTAPHDNYPPQPPQVTGVHHISHTPSQNYQSSPPAPPQVAGVHHISHNTPYMDSSNYPPPPQQPPYDHQSSTHHEYGSHHEGGGGGSHHFTPHMPSFMTGHSHQAPGNVSHGSNDFGSSGGEFNKHNLEGYFGNKTVYKIYCKASGNTYAVGIRDDKVVLTYADPSDRTQYWYKDEKYSTKVKDEDGYPSFSLVNKATGRAMKQPISGNPVELIPFEPDRLDASILWTESKDLGSGYRTIRNVNNVKMVLDAFNGDKDHGGVHDGTFLSIFKSWKGDNQNQQWKLIPY